jgi:hypothetical protein
MKSNPKKLLRDAIIAEEQPTLFSSSESALEDACVAFLRFKGYRVARPVEYKVKIKSLDDLIKFFYILLDSRHPEYANAYRNLKRDRAIAKRLVDSRMEATGSSREVALNECGEIIATLFEHEKEFKFRTEIYFGMFGQANLGWITEKAIRIMNERITREAEARVADKISQIEKEQKDEYDLEFNDVDSILQRIEGGK